MCEARRSDWIAALEADDSWEDLLSEDRPLPHHAA